MKRKEPLFSVTSISRFSAATPSKAQATKASDSTVVQKCHMKENRHGKEHIAERQKVHLTSFNTLLRLRVPPKGDVVLFSCDGWISKGWAMLFGDVPRNML